MLFRLARLGVLAPLTLLALILLAALVTDPSGPSACDDVPAPATSRLEGGVPVLYRAGAGCGLAQDGWSSTVPSPRA